MGGGDWASDGHGTEWVLCAYQWAPPERRLYWFVIWYLAGEWDIFGNGGICVATIHRYLKTTPQVVQTLSDGGDFYGIHVEKIP